MKMETLKTNGYVSGALLMSKKINEMREYVEYEKFLARMLVDNDDTREMKENTDIHRNSLHKFIYNNPEIDKFTMRGKMERIGKTAYTPDINSSSNQSETTDNFHNESGEA